MNWRRNLIISKIIAFVFFFSSCSTLTSEGELYMKSVRKKYSCFEITNGVGDGYKGDSKNMVHYVYFTFTSCDKPYSFNNILNEDSVALNLANVFFNYTKNNNDYQGIELIFNKFTDSPNSKRFFYLENEGKLIQKSKTEESSAF